jgi:hypothetical protein
MVPAMAGGVAAAASLTQTEHQPLATAYSFDRRQSI